MRTRSLTIWTFSLVLASIAFTQEGEVARDGFSLHWRTEGSGTPVILLSGRPGAEVDLMRPVAKLFPEGYQLIYLEQRGTGRSRPATLTPENMTVRLMVDDLEALRMKLQLDRLFLVGSSWGGQLAMAYAAERPERVDRMILISPAGATLEFTQWSRDNVLARLRSEDKEAIAYWAEASKRGVDRNKSMFEQFRAGLPGMFFDRLKGLAFAAQMPETSMHFDAQLLLLQDATHNYDVRSGLRKLARPVLIVQGYQDHLGQKVVEEIHGLIRSSVLRYIPKCGHVPAVEQPEELRAIINDFLKTN
jgi:proline iminopeptidase